MSRLWKAERGMRCVFKVLEFITSAYFVFVMYHVGPHWIMLVASLAVPVYGLYLVMARSVDPSSNQGLHSIPYLRYKTLIRAKIWQRADIAISLSMSVIFCGFSAILFFGYFKVRSATSYFLNSAISALLLAFLYTFDALLTVCQLKSGSVDFAKSDRLSRPFTNDTKRTGVQADFTSSGYFSPTNDFKPNSSAIPNSQYNVSNQHPIPLPKSSNAAVPTILDRLRLEIEAEHRYSTPSHFSQQPIQHQNMTIDHPRKSWFDDDRHDELTNSTSLSNTSAQQQQNDRQYWEENRQINDVIIAPTKQYQKTTYSRFQQLDDPINIQPENSTSNFMDSSNSAIRVHNPNKRLNLSHKSSSLEAEEELPPPPSNNIQPMQRSSKSRPVITPANQYKIGSHPYARKPINPVEQQIYTMIPQNRSNRNSETTGTSEEELNTKIVRNSQPSTSRQQNSTVLNYPLNQSQLINDTGALRPAPLVFYKTTQAHVHPPVKARMVVIEDDVRYQPVMGDVSRGSSSKSSATARIDEIDRSSQSSSTRPSLSSTLVHINASH